MKKAIIIGGGPAGLTAAYEFVKYTQIQPIVLEKSEFWGGISRTVNYKGNRIDIGGHRFFSKSDVVMDWWNTILPVLSEENQLTISYQNKTADVQVKQTTDENSDDVFLVRKRKSRIFYLRKFFNYPISLNPQTLSNLGIIRTIRIGFSYMKSVLFPIKKEKNLEDFFINRFGKELYKTFFKDYTEKVWGVKCTEISPEWGAQRVKGLSIKKTILHFIKQSFSSKRKDIKQKDVETSLIEYFLYPKFGPGQMWEKVAEIVQSEKGELHQNVEVVKIHTQDKKVIGVTTKNSITQEENYIEGDYVISTMPVKELIKSLQTDSIPKNVSEIAEGLEYRDFITVGLLLNKINHKSIDDNWIYVQEPDVKVGRIQFFNNWSPFMVVDSDKLWIGLEYFCNEGDELWNNSEEQMKQLGVSEMIKMGMINQNDVVDSVVIKMEKAYPAYFGTYDRIDELITYVNEYENLFLIGRNGMHKYNNQDHSMLTAIETVKNIQKGKFNKDNIWSINTEQEYHESKK